MAIKTSNLYMLFKLPWFIFDLRNLQLITSNDTIPIGDIVDSKQIVLSETPIPGLSYNPVNEGGMGNRKISFTLPLLKRGNQVNNILMLKQFENLRNQAFGLQLTGILNPSIQFNANPKVLYYWGSGSSMPLEWYVSKCDFTHRSSFVNSLGLTQYSEIQMELILDETSKLNQIESIFRKIAGAVGMLAGLAGG